MYSSNTQQKILDTMLIVSEQQIQDDPLENFIGANNHGNLACTIDEELYG